MAMTVPVFRIMYPDLRIVPQFKVDLATNFNFATDTVFDEGYWVKISSGVAAKIGSSTAPTDTWLTYPVITSSARMDVRASKAISVAYGSFIFETTRYTGTPTEGQSVTVAANADGLGVLSHTTHGGDFIFGYVIKAAVSGVNGLIVQTSGWSGTVV